MIKKLEARHFRIGVRRRFRTARTALAEASRHALADIKDSVGGVRLNRHQQIVSIQRALGKGRFVEIRGDAGVGKSGLLKHLAAQIETEANVIVLSPGRTTPNGWTAMRGVLGFDGTAHELLTDLAGDGSTILFLDNLDSFPKPEQRTVIDLVREAARVPGISVVATARSSFGIDEPSWLPTEAGSILERSEPIVVGELEDSEIEELSHFAPQLVPLLHPRHPARDISRNLFRLARLANHTADAPIPQTEGAMAQQWWETGDGPRDELHRERARVLRSLGKQALSQVELFDVSEFRAEAIDALIQSETLNDRGHDQVAFRHDVLREWAITRVLLSDVSLIADLPLRRPASAALARGLELAARFHLESGTDTSEVAGTSRPSQP